METKQESCRLPRNGKRVILFPLPYQGHINPMLQIASVLYSKGFSITIIHTNLNPLNACNYPHFEFHSISASLSETEASTEDIVAILIALNAKCVVPFWDCLVKLTSISNVQEDSFACIITDPLWYFTNSVSAYLAFAAYPILREKCYLPIQDSQLEAPVIECPPLRVKDIPIFETGDPKNVDKVISAMVSLIKASSGIIWNSYRELEQVELTTIHHQYFSKSSSSSLLSQDESCISWLDKHAPKSVIYVSFGSVVNIDETEFLEIAWGLANSRVPFLWVVRPGLVREAEWLELLPKGFVEMLDGRGHIVKWAPQQEVLAHPAVGGFLTHGGWNSTLESICEGVPMICQPYFGDQMVNARYISHVWRLGLHLDGKVERREIEIAVRRVMIETEGQEMRERILYSKEKAHLCLKPGGSSYQSLERLIDHILSF
ncbi:UDP-glycosyltransferase 76B1 [Citrus sinensis]|nr:UDP-glycosyltransferase 76B1 [Citrus sinensis]